MNKQVKKEFDALFTNYPQLSVCADDIQAAYKLMVETYRSGGVIMTCGNGGSAADAEHIVGELMKGFKLERPLVDWQRERLEGIFPEDGDYLADNLQRGIAAISLVSQSSLSSAFINDAAPDMVFAQQVFGYGSPGSLLLGISTSGNSQNVVNACKVAKAFEIGTIGMTGADGGELRKICDVTVRAPAKETYRVQEYHMPIYHTLCAMIEIEMFYKK